MNEWIKAEFFICMNALGGVTHEGGCFCCIACGVGYIIVVYF